MEASLLYLSSYLLGTIPFGLILTHLAGLGDIRKVGSGNIGATNVMRTGHRWLGILTLLLDAGKSAAAVWLAVYFSQSADIAMLCGLLAMCGHMFPIWLKFKGGKGVASVLGVYLAVSWQLFLVTIGLWLLVFAVRRVSALSSLVSIGLSPITAYLLLGVNASIMATGAAILITLRHRSNIARLSEGKELAFAKKQKSEATHEL